MINTELIEKLEQLPPSLQSQVEKMVDHLLEEKANDSSDELVMAKPKLKREFGGLKGFVTYMADDFDAPLEDFKEYM